MTYYIVREHINTDDPTSAGPELKRFETWAEAKEYRDVLFIEEGIESYISISQGEKDD